MERFVYQIISMVPRYLVVIFVFSVEEKHEEGVDFPLDRCVRANEEECHEMVKS